jgi:hypothetical protein
MNPTTALIAVTVSLAAAVFEGYCLVDLARARVVRYLPREAWALIMLITIPFGGMLYLAYGKVR